MRLFSSGTMLIPLSMERLCLETLHSNQLDLFSTEDRLFVSLTPLPNRSPRL